MREPAASLPWVTVKYAQTLDGRIATRSGESQWISSDASLVYAHELRACHDAVLVGVGTVLRDNPRLTVRLVDGPNPLRVVVDSALRTPPEAALFGAPGATLVVAKAPLDESRAAVLREVRARILTLPAGHDGHVDLPALLRRLASEGVRSVLVEGGARVVTALLREQLVHRMVVCVAPKLLGNGVEGVGELGIARLAEALTFRASQFRPSGVDVLFEGDLAVCHPAAFPAPEPMRASLA